MSSYIKEGKRSAERQDGQFELREICVNLVNTYEHL